MDSKKYQIVKIIACVTMLIDHIAVFFGEQCNINNYVLYAMRTIGRISFPLFAFLLVESFYYTKKKLRHAVSILLIAIISELPYNIVMAHGNLQYEYQNICFTLFIGFLMIWVVNIPLLPSWEEKKRKDPSLPDELGVFVMVFRKVVPVYVLFVACLLAYLFKIEYSFVGAMLIYMLNWAHKANPIKCKKKVFDEEVSRNLYYTLTIATYIVLMFSDEYLMCCVSLLIIFWATSKRMVFTNATENKKLKYLLRYFYPLHFILMIIVRLIMTW